jgi:molecular chaperone GrpE (heat shock protein)
MLETSDDVLEVARKLMRAQALRQREVEKELEYVWRALENVSISFVETIEQLQGLLETSAIREAEGSDTLRFALRHALERLDDGGIALDGKVGERFDPARHRAIEESQASERGELLVMKVLSHGVTCAQRRFKPAEVVVHRASEND